MPITKGLGLLQRTRTVMVSSDVGWNATDDLVLAEDQVKMPISKSSWVYGHWVIPVDFVSDLSIQWIGFGSADGTSGYGMLGATYRYGQVGEEWDTHEHFSATSQVSMSISTIQAFKTVALPSAEIGDVVTFLCQRNGVSASDTFDSDIFSQGWLISYTAEY